MLVVPFPLRMHACTISNWARSFDMQKKWKASSFIRRLESIVLYCFSLLYCSGAVHYCPSSILSEFCDRGSTGFGGRYRRLIDLVLPIDSDRLQVRSLGWSDASFGFLRLLRYHIRASYDWNSRQHVPSHWPPTVPFSFLCMGNGLFTFVSTGQNRTKTSLFWLLLYKIPKAKPEGFISVWNILKTVDLIGWSV